MGWSPREDGPALELGDVRSRCVRETR
jgi:hypothetical protein